MLHLASPRAHMDVWLQQALLRVAAYLAAVADDEGVLERYSFLGAAIDAVQRQLPRQTTLAELERMWAAAVAAWESALPVDSELPLQRLRRVGLTDDHLRALVLVGLVEMDSRIGTVYGALHPFPDEFHITVGLLTDLLRFGGADEPGTAQVDGWAIACDLAYWGLITLQHPDRPRAARTLRVPGMIWDACAGEPIDWTGSELICHPQTRFQTLRDLQGLLPEAILERLARVPALAHGGLINGVVVRGMRGSGRLRALGALARSMHRDLLLIRRTDATQLAPLCGMAGPLAVLLAAIPVVELELAPGESVALPALAGYDGLAGVILSREGNLVDQRYRQSARLGVGSVLTLHLPAADVPARRLQWARALNGHAARAAHVIETASQNYHLTLGAVEQAGNLAHAYAALAGHAHVELGDIQEACRDLNQQSLENLAKRIQPTHGWDALVVSRATRGELRNLILRCAHRERVLAHLGRGFTGATRGVRALFSGPSGTGKTLAARIVAAELGLDLYRVELSSVVSKYIGETERNLSQLFARAEEQDIILLLDEGDSLLTARTDVRNSTDRYANMETNYLLQRLEDYEGIILITSNAANRIDGAFQRRMDVVVEFSAPDAGQRRQLWTLHLPESHAVAEAFLRAVALRCTLTGGQIRNAALHATLLGLDAGAPVGDAFVMDGIDREYAKMGASTPIALDSVQAGG